VLGEFCPICGAGRATGVFRCSSCGYDFASKPGDQPVQPPTEQTEADKNAGTKKPGERDDGGEPK
jgi:rubredoxin